MNNNDKVKDMQKYFDLGHNSVEAGDYSNAEKYYLLASEAGSFVAQYNLGVCYYSQICNLKQKLSEQNDPICVKNIESTIKELTEKMLRYFYVTANAGFPNSMTHLASYYHHKLLDIINNHPKNVPVTPEEEMERLLLAGGMEKYYLKAIKRDDQPFARHGWADACRYLSKYIKSVPKEQLDDTIIKYYSLACEKGMHGAMIKLGEYYYEKYKTISKNDSGNLAKLDNLKKNIIKYYEMAIRFNTDPTITKEYYNMAIPINNGQNYTLKSINFLAKFCEELQDYDNMIKYYEMAIKHGNIEALIILAKHYEKQKDYENMIKYYKLSITHNNIDAMNSLGEYYESIKDYENMIIYYRMALDRGNFLVTFRIAEYYKFYNDHENVVKYYLMAIDKLKDDPKKSDMIAMHKLALYYYSRKDYVKTSSPENKQELDELDDNIRKYYLMAINKGCTESMYNLACIYDNEIRQLEKNNQSVNKSLINDMINYFETASKNGSVGAMTRLGRYYTEHNDNETGIKYYMMGVKNGDSYSMTNMGSHYFRKILELQRKFSKSDLACIEKKKESDNLTKTMHEYYSNAINLGNDMAMYNLGKYYLSQINYINTYPKEILETPKIKDELKELSTNLIKYFLMAIEKNNSDAMLELGKYYKSIGDFVNMEKYYSMAIVENNFNAKKELAEYYKNNKEYHKIKKTV